MSLRVTKVAFKIPVIWKLDRGPPDQTGQTEIWIYQWKPESRQWFTVHFAKPVQEFNFILLFFSNAYKCSVFFEDLTPKRPLTWIGALPDALKKAKNKAEAAEILGADVTEESFNNFPGCQDSAANARCYTTVSVCFFYFVDE